MKALSLKQPYAELILSGRKTIELRKWNTKFRGTFLIHASQNIDKNAMIRFGFDNLPLGCIVGKAILANVKKYSNEGGFSEDKERHLADSSWGRYGFILQNAERLKEFPCKGKLRFWDFDQGVKWHL